MRQEKMNMPKIKICGLSRPEDITNINEVKPDYCGFIIDVPKSWRNVSISKVRELVQNLESQICPVGVFVNKDCGEVAQLLNEGTIQIAQLHGQEDEAYIRRIQKNTGHQVIKAFSVKTAQDIENAMKSPADYILLDQGGGGTIAYILANYGMSVIDSGVAVLNMHAPWELISKVDLYEAYNGYVAFLKEA